VEQLGPGVFELDPCDEVEDETLEHDFHRALEAAENLAAQLFAADHTLFLVNGTTSGLHYLLSLMTGTIVIPRFSHQAVYTGTMLSGSECVYIPVRFDHEWLIPLPPTVDEFLQAASGKRVTAAVFTNPTYYGTCAELPQLIEAAHSLGAYAFADEAHGGHFCFSPRLPMTGLAAGADAVVQSTHKNLGSLTQTSMLHIRGEELYDLARRARRVLETTSPSLLLLGVLDEVRRSLAERGRELVEHTVELAEYCSARLEALPGVQVLPRTLRRDPTKIVFSLRAAGLTGIQLEALLRRDYNIQVEFSDYYNVIVLMTLGDTKAGVDRLCSAVEDIIGRAKHLGGRPLPLPRFEYPALPPQALPMGLAVRQRCENVPLQEAKGRIAGGFVTPYPPGVPVLVPGEVVSAEAADYLQWCLQLGWPVRGVEGMTISVIKDNAAR